MRYPQGKLQPHSQSPKHGTDQRVFFMINPRGSPHPYGDITESHFPCRNRYHPAATSETCEKV